MRLEAYRLEKQTLAPGDHAAVTLYLKKLAEAGVAYDVLLRLVAPDGREVWQAMKAGRRVSRRLAGPSTRCISTTARL